MSNLDFGVRSSDLSQFSELKDQLLTAGPLAATWAAAGTLTADQLRAARDSILFVNAETAVDLIVGADTAANAADLQSILGLSQAGDQCLLTFGTATSDIAADVALANASGTHEFVDVDLYGVTGVGGVQVLFNSDPATSVASSLAIVRVTATDVTVGSEVINFDILVQARVAA